MNEHILCVDDDHELRALIAEYLEKQGFRVSQAEDSVAMDAVLEKEPIDLLILDLMLPGKDGLEICRELRARSQIPIIMLTARGDDTDRIVGLEMGADDYLPKPFNPRELLARIKVVLRRINYVQTHSDTPRAVRFGSWTLDLIARHLLDKDGVVVPLSTGEFRLLKVFVEHINQILTRDQLMEITQGREAMPFDRAIDVMVSRLRRRLLDDAREPQLIKTIRSEGYMLIAKPEYLN